MGKKILKTLTNNFGFKLLALLFAVILWLVVYNVDDPVITRNYTTNVTLLNEDSIQDKYFEILDNTNNVTFSVSAKRSYLDKLDDSDFSATADFDDLVVSDNASKGSIKIEIVASRYSGSIKINGSNKFLTVSLEDAKSKQFVVSATTEGTVADGYALGDVSISGSNVIKVSGPVSLVSRIAKVIAAINVDGMSQNLSDNVVPILYDEEGSEIDTTKLKLSKTTVTVNAAILGTKKVSLNLSAKGVPADGYGLAGITSSISTVWIKGATATINPITSIEIPASVLDISGASSGLETTINITDYLPDGVALLDSSEATVTVVVEIEAYETRTFAIPIENITVEGLAVEDELIFSQGAVYVSVKGLAVELDSLNEQTLRGSVDVTELTLGSHVVNVDVEVDESRFVVTSSRTQIVISRMTDENTGEGGTNAAGNTQENNTGAGTPAGETQGAGNGEDGSGADDSGDDSGEDDSSTASEPENNE
jgi:YbbR domain-containing protein